MLCAFANFKLENKEKGFSHMYPKQVNLFTEMNKKVNK